MPNFTPNYNFYLPLVNNATDQDLWGRYLNANWSSIDTDLKTVSTAAQLPIGSLYFNATDATNPATLLGYGTWSALGQGRVLIGVGTGTDGDGNSLTVAAGASGGEYKHTQTTAELAAHTHFEFSTEITSTNPGSTLQLDASSQISPVNTDSSFSTNYNMNKSTQAATVGLSSTAGSSTPFNVTQPYIGVYIWSRTA